MEENQLSEQYIQWMNEKVREEMNALDEFWKAKAIFTAHKIRFLEDTNKSLEQELQVLKITVEEQENDLFFYTTENETLNQLLNIQRDVSVKHVENQTEPIDQLSSSEKSLDKSLATDKNELKNVESNMLAEFDKTLALQKQDAAKELKLLKEKMQEKVDSETLKVSKLEKELSQIDLKYKDIISDLELKLAQTTNGRKRDREYFEKTKTDESTTLKELNNKLEVQEVLVRVLKKSEVSLKHTISKLTETNAETKRQLMVKYEEIGNLKSEKACVIEEWVREKDKTALYRVVKKEQEAKIKSLEKELADTQHELKIMKDRVKKLDLTNFDRGKTITLLRYKLKARDPDICKLNEKVADLQASLLHVKEDIQACMTDIENPKQLRVRLLKLQSRHVKDNKRVQVDESTRTAFNRHINLLKSEVNRTERIHRSHSNERRNWEERLDKHSVQLMEIRNLYIKRLNEKIVSEHNLKQQLKEVTLKLEKATRPTSQRLRSWVNKKVLQSPAVTPEAEEQMPSLYPEDWLPLDPPDDTSTPSVDPGVKHVNQCTDTMPPVQM